MQIIGRKSSNETKKAIRYVKERRLLYQFVDLDERSLSRRELDNIFSFFAPDQCIDTKSRYYRERLAWMEYDAEEELEEHPELFITPILRCRGRVALGFDQAFLEAHS